VSLATCPSCGAPASPDSWTCRYCHATTDPARAEIPSLAGFATLVQAGEHALEEALPGLVAALESALPGAVKVEREGGLLRRTPRIRSVAALLGERRFVLTRKGDGLMATVEHEVRGVVLRHDTVPAGEWLALLAESLRQLAAGAGRVEPALARLLGPEGTGRH
jgi:hypothetical protein